ncbi:leucine-rich repeat receptor protein kinase EMS1-like [Gossypium australe]|uniref:Leucine-rich repeat receptor protein kinase EMS1-like n=1 Tax=Gossypium australe TaxID=47621 RepID=A0A5B6UEF1_9ROSI|nr:leucine-rich repeat receptor protein kinase EMS1-like [Gossypium australe]
MNRPNRLYKARRVNKSSVFDTIGIPAIELSSKLLVNVKCQRVLFAEANKDFIDFLFNIMALPIGTIVRLLNKEAMVGSLSKLYKSIEELSHVYMQQPFQTKEALLNPEVLVHSGVANLPRLLPDIESSNNSIDKGFYRPGFGPSPCPSYIAEDPEAVCPNCRSKMSHQAKLVKTNQKTCYNSLSSSSSSSNEEGCEIVEGIVAVEDCAY